MTLEELEKRVRTLEDVEEIKNLQVSYINYLIKTQWDEIVNCFAENGVFDAHSGIAKGHEAIGKILREKIAEHHIGQEGIFVVHPFLTVDGDKAKGSWLLYMQWAQPRKLIPRLAISNTDDAPDWMQGFYENEYVRENGKWKISYLKWRCRLMSPMQAAE